MPFYDEMFRSPEEPRPQMMLPPAARNSCRLFMRVVICTTMVIPQHLMRGWTSLDPAHHREQTSQYLRVAIGPDHANAHPTRGIFKRNAKEKIDVKVSGTAL